LRRKEKFAETASAKLLSFVNGLEVFLHWIFDNYDE